MTKAALRSMILPNKFPYASFKRSKAWSKRLASLTKGRTHGLAVAGLGASPRYGLFL